MTVGHDGIGNKDLKKLVVELTISKACQNVLWTQLRHLKNQEVPIFVYIYIYE